MPWHVALRGFRFLDGLLLEVDRHRHMSDSSARECRAAGKFRYVFHMGWSHDARVVHADVHEELVQLDILLGVGIKEVMELQAGDREHRNAVELRVVKAVEQMHAARSEEHTSELQSLMRHSYDVFCL